MKNNLLETRQSDSSNEESDSGTSRKQTKPTTCSRIIIRIEKEKEKTNERNFVMDKQEKKNKTL